MERIRAKVDRSKVDFFIAANARKFEPQALMDVRDRLAAMNDDQFMMMHTVYIHDPALMFAVSFFTGWDRFFLDDVVLGIVKVLTCYGVGIWWLVDLFTVMGRTKRYNYYRFMQITSHMG